MKRKIASALILLLCAACASSPFKPGKPITGGGPFNTYLQDGERVSEEDVRSYLRSQPDTQELATASLTWNWISLAPSLAGGFLVGYNLADKNRSSDTGLWVGAGLVVLGIGTHTYAESLLSRAVDHYNQKLLARPTAESRFRVSPLLTLQPGTAAPGAGLQLHWGG